MGITRIGVQPVISQVGAAPGQQAYIVVEGDAKSLPAVCTNDLSIDGNMNFVHWQGDGGATNVYRSDGNTYGLIGASSDGRFIDDGSVQPDTSQQPPEDTFPNNPPD